VRSLPADEEKCRSGPATFAFLVIKEGKADEE
jgi:hypothetical protein